MEDRTQLPSMMLLILDLQDRGTDVSNIPKVLVPLYIEEMELHAEEVFKVEMREDWEEELLFDEDGKIYLEKTDEEDGSLIVFEVHTNLHREEDYE